MAWACEYVGGRTSVVHGGSVTSTVPAWILASHRRDKAWMGGTFSKVRQIRCIYPRQPALGRHYEYCLGVNKFMKRTAPQVYGML